MKPRDVARKHRAIVAALLCWFGRNARDLPWRRTRDPYGIWVSEIMLQQTQVKTVIPYWQRWMCALPSIQSLAKARSEKIHKLWEGLGYYRRVRNLQRAAQLIVRDHGGKFPERFDDVLALPGIGPYTAGAICSIAFDQPQPILDGNVMRLLTRLFGIRGNPRKSGINKELWKLAGQLVVSAAETNSAASPGDSRSFFDPQSSGDPPGLCSRLNQALMELGALVCTPKQPGCETCPLNRLCTAHQEGSVKQLPQLALSRPTTPLHFFSFVVEHRGRFLVRQRAAGFVNAYLWEFPNIEADEAWSNPQQAARKLFGKIPMRLEPLCSFKHSITRYRITLRAYRARFSTRPVFFNAQWIESRHFRKFPFTGAHKKIVKQLRH